MIHFALIIGIVSYSIFFLGVFSLLYPPLVTFIGIVVIFLCIFLFYRPVNLWIKDVVRESKQSYLSCFLFFLIIIQIVCNLVGVLGPELGFDALWYHLTFPKLYLLTHSIAHISGGLLYYSDMPKLGEMLYVIGLSMGNEIIPKLIHFSFGLMTIGLMYQISRRFLSFPLTLFGILFFYTSMVTGWESSSAYIDLIRSFFELLSFSLFLYWYEKRQTKFLILSAVMLGFAISTKLLALGSVFIYALLICIDGIVNKTYMKTVKYILYFLLICFVIPSPWFIFSFINTGNPVYPFFSSLYQISPVISLLNPITLFKDLISLFLFSSDPLSPLYAVFFPLVIFSYRSQKNQGKLLIIFIVIALGVWYITPRTGGGRFILPYLPIFSIIYLYCLKTYFTKSSFYYLLCISVIVTACISIGYRSVANSKYIPYLLKQESKAQFLQRNLNFSYGDFYDLDGYFQKTISNNDRVLLYGFHNLFYINFPFIDNSWVKKGDMFNYIAVQNTQLPSRFSHWKKIYTNPVSLVSLYTNGNIMVKY